MMKKVSILIVIFALIAAPVFAATATSASPWTKESTYANKTLGKLGFGLKNALLGWTELFTEPYDAHKAKGNCLTGIGKGLLNTVVYTVGGVVHVGTFFVPVDVPLPGGGVDIG